MESKVLNRFAKPLMLEQIDHDEAHHVRALRLICLARQQSTCLKRNLAIHFRDERYAVRFLVMLQAIGATWPEPVMVGRPCCQNLSHDEHTIASLMTLRKFGDRPGFDTLIGEMIPDDGRNLIWATSGAVFGLVP